MINTPSQEAVDRLFGDNWSDEFDRVSAIESYVEAMHEVTWPEAVKSAVQWFCLVTIIGIIGATMVLA